MKRMRLVLWSLCIVLSVLSAKAQPAQQWYKGNLHTHSYWSDGDDFPEMIMDWYKSHGYQFVGLSDHNTFQEGEKWTKIQRSKLYEDSFIAYLKRFPKLAVYKADSGRISVRLKTLDEYRPLFEDKNFLIVKSEEITSKFGDKYVHVNATNIQTLIGAPTGNRVKEIMQHAVDAVLAQRKKSGVPMFPHVNHPNFGYSITVQDMIDLKGERFFEVYNGHPLVHNYGDSLRPGMDVMWDQINMAYRLRNQPLMFGLATDDSHNYHEFGPAFSNAGRGWVMVRAASLTPASLIKALEAGDFYSSTGVVLEKMEFSKNTIDIAIKAEPGVDYIIEFIGVKKGSTAATTIEKVNGTTARFHVTQEYLFVRGRITSTKVKVNPFQEGDVEMAWTQPVVAK